MCLLVPSYGTPQEAHWNLCWIGLDGSRVDLDEAPLEHEDAIVEGKVDRLLFAFIGRVPCAVKLVLVEEEHIAKLLDRRPLPVVVRRHPLFRRVLLLLEGTKLGSD